MTFDEAMKTLEAWGSESNRKIYQRHGAGPSVFGVTFGNLEKLRAKVGRDTDLAKMLWASGNADARCLATMIADPAQLTEDELDVWAASIDYHVLSDLFSRNVVSLSPFGQSRMEKWMLSPHDQTCQAAWNLLAIQATHEAALDDVYFQAHLETIERRIGMAKNRTKHAMNGALIAIGNRNEALRKLALAAAGRIGPVEVDHGDTECHTPSALEQLSRSQVRRKAAASG